MQKSQKGFTLIELVVVIVLLGILGVTALAKYQDLSLEATNAALGGIASELSSAAAINYAASVVGVATAITMNSGNDDCSEGDVQGLFASNIFPAGYDIGTNSASCTAAGDTYTCQITDTAGVGTVNGVATIICTGL